MCVCGVVCEAIVACSVFCNVYQYWFVAIVAVYEARDGMLIVTAVSMSDCYNAQMWRSIEI